MFLLTYTNYAILHATRSAWSVATGDLKIIYGFTTDQISNINADFLLFYSIGGIVLGGLGDRYKKNRLIFVMYLMIAIVMVGLGCVMFIPVEN